MAFFLLRVEIIEHRVAFLYPSKKKGGGVLSVAAAFKLPSCAWKMMKETFLIAWFEVGPTWYLRDIVFSGSKPCLHVTCTYKDDRNGLSY